MHHEVESAACREAVRLLGMGLWPIPITSPKSLNTEAPGKAPIGFAWGATRPDEARLRAVYAANYDAGVGLLLGESGGVIDVEMDGCADAEAAFARIMGGECVETMGWSSRRGPHSLFRWDDRLAKYAKSKFATFGIPGVECRIGALPGHHLQVQSVCPPSLIGERDEHGVVQIVGSRRWNGIDTIAPLPDAFFAWADALWAEEEARRTAARSIERPTFGPATDATIGRYAHAAFEAEIGKLESAPPGNRNNQLNASAFVLGQLVAARALDRATVEGALKYAASRIGQGEREAEKTIRSGLEKGLEKPRDLSGVVGPAAIVPTIGGRKPDPATEEQPAEPTLADIATASDLIRAEAGITWLWKDWMQQSVLCLLAAEPGIGKTRFCLDLARRIALGLSWPDGSPPTLPVGTRTLWVAADNQHAELATGPGQYGFDPDLLCLNTTKNDLYGGTELQTKEQLAALEFNIRCVRPGIVFIDTITQTTDLSSFDTADAKKQYKPLQEIAKRCNVTIVVVTHLANSGKAVGKRVIEKCRTVLMLTRPDKDGQPHRRRLWVDKSNSPEPAPLGVTMGPAGNDYDLDPPTSPDDDTPGRPTIGGPVKVAAKTQVELCMDRICDLVFEAKKLPLSDIRKACSELGFGGSTFKAARDKLRLKETTSEGQTWVEFSEY